MITIARLNTVFYVTDVASCRSADADRSKMLIQTSEEGSSESQNGLNRIACLCKSAENRKEGVVLRD